jgi:predicted metal-dependent peptidase
MSERSSGQQRRPGELEAWLAGFLRDPGFLQAYPYYAAILAKLTPVADPSVGRMAVSVHDGRFFLHINVDAFQAEPQFLRGVLLHEVHHIVLGHLANPRLSDVEEPELMELATEMSANEYIEEPLPPHITCRSYSAIGIRPRQSTWERYEILVRCLRETGKRPRPSPGEPQAGTIDDHRFLARGKKSPGGLAQTGLLIDRAVSEARADIEAREEVGQEPPRRHLVAGRSPERLVEELFDTTRAPEEILDWRSALALFVARARAPVHTWSRPSRRFPERIFEVPGRTWVPQRSENPRLLVALDTSLSMTRSELEEIARQLVVLGEKAHVTVVECDVAISRVYPFAGKIDSVVGRGGTDLRPVFVPSFLGAHDIDGVVYFTDGEGPFPNDPPSVPTLWVLTKPLAFRCPWGQRASLRAQRL